MNFNSICLFILVIAAYTNLYKGKRPHLRRMQTFARPRESRPDATNFILAMTQDDMFWTFQTAIQQGGSFYKKLGEAGLVADADNKAALVRAFPRLIQQYGPSSTLYVRPANPKKVTLPDLK